MSQNLVFWMSSCPPLQTTPQRARERVVVVRLLFWLLLLLLLLLLVVVVVAVVVVKLGSMREALVSFGSSRLGLLGALLAIPGNLRFHLGSTKCPGSRAACVFAVLILISFVFFSDNSCGSCACKILLKSLRVAGPINFHADGGLSVAAACHGDEVASLWLESGGAELRWNYSAPPPTNPTNLSLSRLSRRPIGLSMSPVPLGSVGLVAENGLLLLLSNSPSGKLQAGLSLVQRFRRTSEVLVGRGAGLGLRKPPWPGALPAARHLWSWRAGCRGGPRLCRPGACNQSCALAVLVTVSACQPPTLPGGGECAGALLCWYFGGVGGKRDKRAATMTRVCLHPLRQKASNIRGPRT